jgi:hypothetical protein
VPVAKENMLTVMQWLSSDVPGGPEVAESLALLVFQGDMLWMNDVANVDYYADTISAWVTGSAEAEFAQLTQEGSESAPFIDWITPVIAGWRAAAGQEEAGHDGAGLENPNYADDPTPGTQFYKYDDGAGTYLYAAEAVSDDWATYEQRRYSEPAFDDSYGLGYRYDKRDEVYEWLDEQNGTWNSQEWADAYVAERAAAEGAAEAEPEAATWDENWQMFYRIGADGTYQYAHAVVPGDSSSGCSEVWLSYEDVMAQVTEAGAAQAGADQAPGVEPEALQVPGGGVIEEVMSELGEDISDLAQEADLSEEELAELVNDPEFEQMVAEEVAKLLAEQDS